jgi:hypothetical protein
MSGPAPGKHKIKITAYIHEKGKSLARITHIDLEGKDISEIIKPGEITFIKGKEGGAFIALKKQMIKRAENKIKKSNP